LDALLVKFTFLQFHEELMFPESFQDFPDVLRNTPLVEHIMEAIVHEVLEGRWGVAQSKRHDQVLKTAITSPECHFPFIPRSDTDEVVGSVEVDLGEVFGLLEAVEEISYEGQRVMVFFSDAVQSSVVHA
ncbi:hypothetical protein BOTBODRAFT_120841, partial [Botryobasidium botryosum FD-172 SS1]